MKTRTRTKVEDQTYLHDLDENLDLEALSEDELETFLFEEEKDTQNGFWNLPTMAGLSLILVGVAYFFQELGWWNGFDLSVLAAMLPWLAGILIILLGFGVLSWRPNRKKKAKKSYKAVADKLKTGTKDKSYSTRKRKLVRSQDKKIAGVAGGIAEYFNIDPTLVRIAFVIGTIASGGPFLLAYIILSFVMPKPDTMSIEERITIIRDS